MDADCGATSKRILYVVAIVVVLGGAQFGLAQLPVEFSGPRLGYVFDESHRIRPVLGTTGSARIADPIVLDFELQDATPLPGSDYALALPQGESPVILHLNVNPIEVRRIDSLEPNPTKAIVSQNASSLALYYAAAARIVLVNGLPEKPQLAASINLSQARGEVHQIALNDEGTRLVVAFSSGEREVLIGWDRNDNPHVLTSASRVTSLSFIGNDVVAADSDDDEVFLLHDPFNSATRISLMPIAHEAPDTMVMPLFERGEIYVASLGSGEISALDIQGHLLRKFDCGCAFSGFFPLSHTTFRLTAKLGQPVFIYDAGWPEGRIAFIPAIRQ
jgi:hypothetical protein